MKSRVSQLKVDISSLKVIMDNWFSYFSSVWYQNYLYCCGR